jgi:hypothetical protein
MSSYKNITIINDDGKRRQNLEHHSRSIVGGSKAKAKALVIVVLLNVTVRLSYIMAVYACASRHCPK